MHDAHVFLCEVDTVKPAVGVDRTLIGWALLLKICRLSRCDPMASHSRPREAVLQVQTSLAVGPEAASPFAGGISAYRILFLGDVCCERLRNTIECSCYIYQS